VHWLLWHSYVIINNKAYYLFKKFSLQKADQKDVKPVYDFICNLEETNFDYPAFEIIYNKNIQHKDYFYLVAVTEKQVIAGFISCNTQSLLHHCWKVTEIQELYVNTNYRSIGIGQQIIVAVEKELAKSRCLLVEVTAQNKRTGTHHFYTTNGFECTHKKFVKLL